MERETDTNIIVQCHKSCDGECVAFYRVANSDYLVEQGRVSLSSVPEY